MRTSLRGVAAAALLGVTVGTGASAAPVEFDTAEAHVIVVRPVDRWSGDRGAQDNSIRGVRERNAAYFVAAPDGSTLRGFGTVFQRPNDHELVRRIAEIVKTMGGEAGQSQHYLFHVLQSMPLEPGRYPTFAAAETEAFRQQVLTQGDPATLQDRVAGRKFGAGLLTAAVALGAGNALGSNATGAFIGSGLASEVYEVASGMGQAFIPAELPPLADAASYRSIDVRQVSYAADMRGQIVIAYRQEKTQDAELNALARAIATVAGVDTTVDQVDQSRKLEYARRLAIWSACVEAGACKATPEVAATGQGMLGAAR